MKTKKEYADLHDALEQESRILKGCWLAFTKAKHHGLGSFALYEAAERDKVAMQVANHMLLHRADLALQALPVVPCDYETPEATVGAMLSSIECSMRAADALHAAMISAGENPYFVKDMISKMRREKKEAEGVMKMLSKAATPESRISMNASLLEKYQGD